mmetsp:Transcript_27744/g.85110  ORF Transcript_27744/g.85110 Transcript_27744/m.85110 type:complete len:249 (+) Transcript_27744:632-1378(+)
MPPCDPYVLATTLYVWQFPHFFALAWRHRVDYARGGYAMVAVADPKGERTARLVWNYALYGSALPFLAYAAGTTSSMFALEGAGLNALLLYAARRFGENRSNANAAFVFRVTLVTLPVLLLCFVLHSTRLKDTADDGAVTLGDALEPLRLAGQRLCVHEFVAHARRPTTPSFCPLDRREGETSSSSSSSSDEDEDAAAPDKKKKHRLSRTHEDDDDPSPPRKKRPASDDNANDETCLSPPSADNSQGL